MSKLKDYPLGDQIVNGALGNIYKVEGNQNLCVKVIDLSKTSVSEGIFISKLKIWYSLDHPFILRLEDYFTDDTYLCIVMEKVEGTNLRDYILSQKVSKTYIEEKMIVFILQQLLLALKYCHQNRVMHCGIKPESILITPDNDVKLIGFTLEFEKPRSFGDAGPFYYAPELFEETTHDASPDIWSIGCVLYELMTLRPAFPVKLFDYYKEIGTDYSFRLKRIVHQMLQTNPEYRIEVEDALRSQLFDSETEIQVGPKEFQPGQTLKLTIKRGSEEKVNSFQLPVKNLTQLQWYEHYIFISDKYDPCTLR